VVDQGVAEARVHVTLGHGHADGGGQPLAQGAGGGLDAGRMTVLRVARRVGAELPEVADLLHGYGLHPGEVQQAVEQHRAMARREHEAVAVGPVGAGRVVLQELREQHGGDVGHAHGHALVAGLRLVDRIHRKGADRIGHQLKGRGHGR
jgi:hypothetical protein